MSTGPDLTSGWLSAYDDTDSGALWQEQPIPVLGHAIDLFGQRGKRTVVDVGCGDGRNLLEFARRGFQCVGLDLSSTALKRSHVALTNCGAAAFLIPGSCDQLPFADRSVDAISCFDVFGQLAKPELFLAEAHRVLVSDGVLAINAFTPRDSEFGVGEALSERTFSYRGTLFRFFEEAELRDLLADWNIVHFENVSWNDPPHGTFRPYAHTHDNWYVVGTPR